MAFLIGGANSAADTGYDVDNSCRFNDGDSDSLNITPGSAGNRKTWTFSAWCKLSGVADSYIFAVGAEAGERTYININAGTLVFQNRVGSSNNGNLITNALYRDPSAWYHFVVGIDSTQSTAANRIKMYVNGTQVTSFETETYFDQNQDTFVNNTQEMGVGKIPYTAGQHYDGYMAEVVLIDGTQYAASDFGEFDEDSPTIWKPKDVSGLTFGTNGFYLDFKASGNLGNDANGGTDLTEVNLAATDQATDTPTNNFATFNPLFNNTFTFSEGNCVVNADAGSAHQLILSTIAPTNGVWYAEFKITDLGGDYAQIGIRDVDQFVTAQYVGQGTRGYGYSQHGTIAASGSNAATGQTAISANDIIGVWMDLDNQVLKWYINDTLEYTYSSVTAAYSYAFAVSIASSTSGQWEGNFGGSPGFAISSGNQDPNGYGNFEFTTKSGYALCTKNLAEYG